jgi:hypothetical protein
MESMNDDLAGSTPSRDANPTSRDAPGAQVGDSAELGGQSRSDVEDESVRRRAYEIYLSRDGAAGDQDEDWLTAEREIRGRSRDDRQESRGRTLEDQG